MSNFIAQLEALFRYFQINRQVGHTTAMLEGAKNVPCLVLANNQAGKNNLKITGLKEVVTLPEIEGGRLCGLNRPLLIDNAAMAEILGGALHEIEGAKAALLIANRSADDQMRQKRAAESEVIRLKNALTAQSDHWQEIEAIAKEFGIGPDMSLASENLPEGRWSYNDPCSGKLFREDEVADEVIRRIKELRDTLKTAREEQANQAAIIRASVAPASERERLMLEEIQGLRTKISDPLAIEGEHGPGI
jgi:hypothetical protein